MAAGKAEHFKDILLALADGKEVQWRHNETDEWVKIEPSDAFSLISSALKSRLTYGYYSPDRWRVKSDQHIYVNGLALNAPIKEKPEIGHTVYVANPMASRPDDLMVSRIVWSDSHYDNTLLRREILHENASNANAHAAAMIINKKAGGY